MLYCGTEVTQAANGIAFPTFLAVTSFPAFVLTTTTEFSLNMSCEFLQFPFEPFGLIQSARGMMLRRRMKCTRHGRRRRILHG